ncbi:hypothetical protein N7532_007132 [Penicillium argentinense]|uniref:Uncharacterized protein n=1 Tax=Penicillium argentinense TaxID=1131581 RepID=A0A9W9FH99_9EURO|nr:uncharacterized protein N7532_007132 [Penicillium argentinense]KAJ5100131.1 hypothetical protein N7532_007132 [Penicillium argentinense]
MASQYTQVTPIDLDIGYYDLGAYSCKISTNSKATQAAFDKKDLEHSVRASFHISKEAKVYLNSAAPWEQAMVNAIQFRFPTEATSTDDDFAACNVSYADAMRDVYQKFGAENLDVITLSADALMNTRPWDLFEILGHGLSLPGVKHHPGICHMYIHLMEMSETPEAALVPADHLRNLVPDGGHMHHMPSHLDVLIGDYRRSIDSNMKVTMADDKYYRHEGGLNFYSFYRIHNYHSLIYAAMMAGQSKVALESSDRMETTITEELLRIKSPPMVDWMEFFKSVRLHVMIRFGLWEEIKKLAVPEDKDLYCVTIAFTHYAKGVAYAATNNLTAADKERSLYQEAARRVPPTRLDFPNRVVDELKVATAMLDGEIEYRRGNYQVDFEKLREAVYNDDDLLYSEPWGWMLPARHPYAALLLEQGHVEEAAAIYAQDLGLDDSLIRAHQHRNNVWSLRGYHVCLMRLGRGVEANIIEKQLKTAAAVADVSVMSSCFCKTGLVQQ